MNDLTQGIHTFLSENREWLFGGIGITIVTIFWDMIKAFFKKFLMVGGINITNTINNVVTPPDSKSNPGSKPLDGQGFDLVKRKKLLNILFIDDETDFKVVKILKRNGWVNTRIVKDVKSVNDQVIIDADVCFVDIQGVAKDLFKKDQGLGLVGAIVDNHPEKKVVVYSAQKQGNRFNALLEKAHARLAKNASLYEFENLVTNFSEELYK